MELAGGSRRSTFGQAIPSSRPLRHGLHGRGPPVLRAGQGARRPRRGRAPHGARQHLDKFAHGFRPQLGKLMVERMGENDAIVTRFLDDADFQQTASEVLAHSLEVPRARRR